MPFRCCHGILPEWRAILSIHDAVSCARAKLACKTDYDLAVESFGWFAIFTNRRYEKKVTDHFQYLGIESFLPTYSCKRTWKNRQKVTLKVPLFPNYLFARFESRQRGFVLGVPGVQDIISGPRHANAVPDHYIETLRTGLALGRILPHYKVEVGDRVRIVAGPMAGVEGVLARIRSEFRVVLTIESIRQSVSIEVFRDEIEPLVMASNRSTFGLRWDS